MDIIKLILLLHIDIYKCYQIVSQIKWLLNTLSVFAIRMRCYDKKIINIDNIPKVHFKENFYSRSYCIKLLLLHRTI